MSPAPYKSAVCLLCLCLCLGLLITGMGDWPIRFTDEESNICGDGPCCWNKTLVQEARRTPKPLTRLEAQSHRGRVILWDPENRWTFSEITEETCRISVRRTPEGKYVVESGIFPHPVPLTIQMHPGSDFYMGIYGEKDVFVFQQYPGGGGGSLTHTTYDKNGELEYGKCGVEEGYIIKACNTVDLVP